MDREARTPRISGSFAAFYDASREIEQRLAIDRAALATDFRVRAKRLADTFARWPEEPPDVALRSLCIQELVDLNGEVHAYLDGQRQAIDLLDRINGLSPLARTAPLARRLTSEIERIVEDFIAWRSERPPEPKARVETIQALVVLTDQVNALLRGER